MWGGVEGPSPVSQAQCAGALRWSILGPVLQGCGLGSCECPQAFPAVGCVCVLV